MQTDKLGLVPTQGCKATVPELHHFCYCILPEMYISCLQCQTLRDIRQGTLNIASVHCPFPSVILFVLKITSMYYAVSVDVLRAVN